MAENKPKIIVVGSLVYDLVAWAERRPEMGETLLGASFGMFPGGKGANQAVQAARLGADVVMAGRVGCDFFGESLIKSLKGSGVNTEHVIVDSTTTTAVGCIVVDKSGNNSIVMVPQANMNVTRKDVDKIKPLLKDASILLLQLEIPIDVVLYAAKVAYKAGVTVILNPAPSPRQKVPKKLFKLTHVVTPNEIEARTLTGKSNIKKAASDLLKAGAETAIVTLGERGCFLQTKGGKKHFPAYKVKAVDTTAAGDAFNGALAVALSERKNLTESISFASAAAALSVTKPGAQPSLPYRKEVRSFLKTYSQKSRNSRRDR